MKYQILQGDNRETLKTIPDNSIDAIVTDPPYGIDFLGKAWDANTGALETYQECLRVLKPGGHILAFSAARTYHHLAITLEQAGFEIRDQIMWIYSSGFPKSQDIGRSIQRSLGVKETVKKKTIDGYNLNNQKGFTENSDVGYGEMKPIAVCTDPEAQQWEGWGTALKPAHEPIALARKPLGKNLSIAKNALKYGTGALNIDATRIETTDKIQSHFNRNSGAPEFQAEEKNIIDVDLTISDKGRFPSNVIGEIQEEYQKYFYCPKVSRSERHMGFDTSIIPTNPNGILDNKDENGNQVLAIDSKRLPTEKGNNHPTVKPVALMEYLIKLVTPPGGTVLDPFNGSGSTGMAATGLGYDYIGCELDPAYVEISNKRIEAWLKKDQTNNFEALFSAA
jgi:DNA modification methylase